MFPNPTLFGLSDPAIDPEFASLQRTHLPHGAWVDYQPRWLDGDETLFETLLDRVEWTSPVVRMFDNDVQTPRLTGRVRIDFHAVIAQAVDGLSARYGVRLDRLSAGLYRDGDDSVAWHGDRIARERKSAIVATVSLGAPRRFLLRPVGGGEATKWSLGFGDLVVMGGSCQRTYQHTVPKVAHAEPRMALMFRHAYD